MALSQLRAVLPKAFEPAKFLTPLAISNLTLHSASTFQRASVNSNTPRSRPGFYENARNYHFLSTTSRRHLLTSPKLAENQTERDSTPVLDPTPFSKHAVKLSEEAFRLHTFGVGGVLVDNQGTVHYCQHNKVLVNDCIHDPTAHGERQIISW